MERISRVVRAVLRHFRDSRGATLYEITAAVAMAGILAAVAAPVIIERVGEAKVARAVGEIDAIWAGMQNFQRDTGKMPGEAEAAFLLFTGTTGTVHAALPDISDGAITVGSVSLSGTSPTCSSDKCKNINDYLVRDPNTVFGKVDGKDRYQNWKGPYTDEILTDPFDRAYITNVAPLYKQEPAGSAGGVGGSCGFGWIITGSADRVLETKLTDTALHPTSDDIGKNKGKKIGPGAGCS
ncbi:MAG: hypothetical protein HY726_16670 [Candidatus Rokubacteria bacterium]|nr:hypothetical protein [Candidatus Rokubacteria bacterium]